MPQGPGSVTLGSIALMKLAGWLLFLILTAGLFFLGTLGNGNGSVGMVSLCASCLPAGNAQLLPPLAAPPPRPPAFVKPDLPYPEPPAPAEWKTMPGPERLASVQQRVQPLLVQELAKKKLRLGAPVFIRIFKETRELELWVSNRQGWQFFRSYPVAAMSGQLGPKFMEGDGQAPEGVYHVPAQALNPGSDFHLSFNLGYPNAYDAYHGRTGSFLMVHGNQVSIGCYAMTDPVIEEIYLLVDAALKAGQPTVPVHSFPFRMTDERMQQAKSADTEHLAFWQELLPVFQVFEKQRSVPKVKVQRGRYTVVD